MNVAEVKVDRAKARDLFKQYKKHQHYSEPIDQEIQRAYQLIAQGRMVIRALESIRLAGLGDDHLPKLAICRADKKVVGLSMNSDGSARFTAPGQHRGARGQEFAFPRGSFQRQAWVRAEASLPLIPIHLRPKRAMAAYHVLWEAEWTPVPPRDPYLLRRIGGDLWLVVAAWDLTEVERAAMATRMAG